MRKSRIIFYCITLMLFCQVVAGWSGVWADEKVELTEVQEAAIKDHCEAIRDSLKKVQKEDSRLRVYLGAYYETMLTKFIIPLNVRLVEENLSNAKLVENQNKFAEAKSSFVEDFVDYQKGLEGLIAMDCKVEPEGFYVKLTEVRQGRTIMEKDVAKLNELAGEHVKLVKELKGRLK